MKRFVWLAVAIAVGGAHAQSEPTAPDPTAAQAVTPQTRADLDSLIEVGFANRWESLAIGERVGRFARALAGAPYLEGTLEGPGPEVCRITTRGYDCVTFMELCLNLGRIVRPGGSRPGAADLEAAITKTRYRRGRIEGYASRLHYTSEWIADNIAKGVVEDVTLGLGGVTLPLSLDFMSTHPQSYPALQTDPAMVPAIREIEKRVSRVPRLYVPRSRVAGIESKLHTGDLVAIATSIRGLDYSHTGLVVLDEAGVARFVHASSKNRRVMVDGRISDYLARGPQSNIGITVVRPVNPR